MFTKETMTELLSSLKDKGYSGSDNELHKLLIDAEFHSHVDKCFNKTLKTREGADKAYISAFVDFLVHMKKKFKHSDFQENKNGAVDLILFHSLEKNESNKRSNFDIVIRLEDNINYRNIYLFNVRFHFQKDNKSMNREYLLDLYNGNVQRIN